MNDQDFIKAQQFFDNLFISETVFSDKYAYVEAGVLMEEGKYVEALAAFNKVNNVAIPAMITDFLKAKIYSAGQAAYKAGNMTEAGKNFRAIRTYKRSADYLLLVDCSEGHMSVWPPSRTTYLRLVKLLGFENADEIILKSESIAILFLEGRWEDGAINPYYFEMQKENDGGWQSQYNLPHKNADGYYYISDAIYSVGETKSSAIKHYKFSIIDEDTMYVYCYKDGSTYKMYRQ